MTIFVKDCHKMTYHHFTKWLDVVKCEVNGVFLI